MRSQSVETGLSVTTYENNKYIIIKTAVDYMKRDLSENVVDWSNNYPH